jgi:putative membrane protein
MISGLILSSCNEPRRGNDSNVNETRDEAAAEENSDKFAGKTERDAEFVYDVVASNYAEIKLAELASQKSRTPEVKEIAEKLLNDHAASLNELKTLAQAKAIAVPVEEKDDARRRLQDLSEESTEDFEKKWCDQMVGMHEKSIDNFEDRLEDTEDAELKAFLNKTLPVLKQHQEQLKACQEKLKNQDA